MQDSKIVADAMQKSAKNIAIPPAKRDIRTTLADMKPLLQQALPKHLTADRVIQMATNYVRQNSVLARCTEQSLIGAVMQASILGLEPVQALGQVYFVPYKANKGTREQPNWVDEVQFQLGYRGILRLIHNSKEVKTIYAEVVREGDIFEYELGLHPKLKHIPNPEGKENAKITHVYGVAHTIYGGEVFRVLTRNKIESLRKRNRAQKEQPSGAWQTDYEEMAKAKVIKQLAKYLPLSLEVEKALAANESVITEKAFTNDGSGIDIEAVERAEDDWIADFEANDTTSATSA